MNSVGYRALIDRYDLKGPLPWHLSELGPGPRRVLADDKGIHESFPLTYDPGPADLDHLLFALRYDGVDLRLLKTFLPIFNEDELVESLTKRTHGMPLRRLWFLYEWLLRKPLPIPDIKTGNYGDLLDPDVYMTAPLFRSQRHRIVVNTLGTSHYCPMVRKTTRLNQAINKELHRRASTLTQSVDATVLARATSYLYMKETRTSWDIEREVPSPQRMERFLTALRQPPTTELSKAHLITAHNAIVDPQYFETNYRHDVVYIGEQDHIDYIAPKPDDVSDLMDGLIDGVDYGTRTAAAIAADMTAVGGGIGRGEVLRKAPISDPIIHAALVGFGFVYIHPFADGNGRLHRYLIQHILGRRAFSPPDFIVPVSPALLRDREGYLHTLNSTSQEVLPAITYTRHRKTGRVTVTNDTIDAYRYPDFTAHCEYLYDKIEEAIERDVHSELVYLQTYDRAHMRARLVHRLPEAQEQLLLRLCFAEGGITASLRKQHFADIPDRLFDALVQTIKDTIADCPLPQSFLTAQALEQG